MLHVRGQFWPFALILNKLSDYDEVQLTAHLVRQWPRQLLAEVQPVPVSASMVPVVSSPLNRNVKIQSSLTKLCALYFEYIYERTAKLRCKILFNSGVIVLQISMTKNLSFQHNFA